MGLEQGWSIFGVIDPTTICTSLAFDHLAVHDDSKRLTLIHTTPELVNIGTPRTSFPSTKPGYLQEMLMSVLQVILSYITVLFGLS
jgi:hypothetical protein